MPAGKSPNNAFILHKEKMAAVFRNIQIDSSDMIVRSITLMEALKPIDNQLSTSAFYWVNFSGDEKYLFSKGYVNIQGEFVGDKGTMARCEEASLYSINKVRQYYTDGVRAIGAME